MYAVEYGLSTVTWKSEPTAVILLTIGPEGIVLVRVKASPVPELLKLIGLVRAMAAAYEVNS